MAAKKSKRANISAVTIAGPDPGIAIRKLILELTNALTAELEQLLEENNKLRRLVKKLLPYAYDAQRAMESVKQTKK